MKPTGHTSQQTPNLNRVFGSKGWDDLNRAITKQVQRKWRGQLADIEDAVGDAVLRLVEYWLDLDSSQAAISEDPDKAFAFARWYGVGYALTRLQELAADQSALEWLDAPVRRKDGGDENYSLGDYIGAQVDVEEIALSPDPEQAARQFMRLAFQGPRKRWTMPIAFGETVTAQQHREGISDAAVIQGRRRACASLKPDAVQLGLSA